MPINIKNGDKKYTWLELTEHKEKCHITCQELKYQKKT